MTEATKILKVDPVKETVIRAQFVLAIRPPDGGPHKTSLTKSRLLIGKSTECDLVLTDDYVSGRHCLLEQEESGWILSDLGSTNGTFVNGCKIRKILLLPGSEIRLGKTVCFLEQEEKEEKIEPLSVDHFMGIVGKSEVMRRLFAKIQLVAPTDHAILIHGESGTGKELVAKALHELSPRKSGPYRVLNCGAISPNLIESELFGHEKGAFTGAQNKRVGAFEQADGGTLFLDEIGELPLELQPKLLRVLENRTIRRVGGDSDISINVRVVAATNRVLVDEVKKGKFREDLFYRLFVIPLFISPLRERKGDIPLLADFFAKNSGGAGGKKISKKACDALTNYPWPGNVRELKNVILRSLVFCPHETLEAEHLEFSAESRSGLSPVNLEEAEKEKISQALVQSGGNKSKAAELLGIAKSTLFKKLREYGLTGGEE